MSGRYTKHVFENGLTFLLSAMDSVESATALVMVRSGSRDEPEELSGISHFLEHMVFKGTQKYPSAQVLSSTIDAIGGEFNAFTSKEFTGFYVKLASQHLKLGVDVLSEMLVRPRLLKDDIEREKGVIVEEINMYEDLLPRKVGVVFDRLMYGDNGLGRDTLGVPETVTGLSRKNFLDYLRKHYTADRVVVGIAGGIGDGKKEETEIKKLVGEAFSNLASGKDSRWGGKIGLTQKVGKIKVFEKETGQAHFVLGVRAFRRGHQDRYALAVLSTILGGNMSSRLFSEIREKRGLAYYVKTDVDTFHDTGSFVVQAGVDVGKIDQALKVALEQMKLASLMSGKGSVSNSEVKKAKEFIKGRYILELEDSREVADIYVRRFLLEGKILTPEEFLKKIDEVKREDVIRVARKVFVEKHLNLAVIGPYSKKKDGQRLKKLLKWE